MIQSLCPVPQELHIHVPASSTEGCPRMAAIWQCVDSHSSQPSSKERIWEWMAPVPAEAAPAVQIEPLSFAEERGSFAMKTNWKFETSSSGVLVSANSEKSQSTSTYTTDWAIQEFHEQEVDGKQSDYRLIDARHIEVKISEGDRLIRETHHLEKPFPWIQHMEIGLKNFILSSEKEFPFYVVLPNNGEVVPLIAKKMGEEEIPGFGRVVVVETAIHPSSWYSYFPAKLFPNKMCFDPQTGVLRTLVAGGAITEKRTIEFLPATH